MNEPTSLGIIALSQKANQLLENAHASLAQDPSEKVRALADTFPSSLADEGVPRVVVAGQYSAGKSTLLKALTGLASIEVGEAITTDRPQAYRWEGIELVDTPGIETSLRPDHDALSYQEIAAADLILYVISNELMDEHIAENFRKLAVEQQKAHKMMLVVNKMDRHPKGNTPQARAIVRDALDPLLHPYTSADIPVAFVAAELAISAASEPDEELARFDREDSNFEAFYAQLDAFIRHHKLAGQFTRPLHQLQHALMSARANLSDDSPSVAGAEQMLLQKRKRLVDGKLRIEQRTAQKVRQAASDIRKTGTHTASRLDAGAPKKTVEQVLREGETSADTRGQRLVEELQHTLIESLKEIESDLAKLANSQFSRAVIARAVRKLDQDVGLDTFDPETLHKVVRAGEHLSEFGAWLTTASAGVSGGAKTLLPGGDSARDQVPSLVEYVGKKIGAKGRTLQTVEWSRRIGNAGKVLTVAGPLVSMGAQAFADYQASRQEGELKQLRDGIRRGFNDAADQLEMHFDAQTGTFVTETVLAEIEKVDREIESLRGERTSKNQRLTQIEALLTQTRALIGQIHAASTT